MLNNFRIGPKIYSGFGVVLLVLAAISGFAVVSNLSNKDSFHDYRAVARITTEEGRIQANMLEARLAFLKFRNDQTEQNMSEVRQRLGVAMAAVDKRKRRPSCGD